MTSLAYFSRKVTIIQGQYDNAHIHIITYINSIYWYRRATCFENTQMRILFQNLQDVPRLFIIHLSEC